MMGCQISAVIRKSVSDILSPPIEKASEPVKQVPLYAQICSETCGSTAAASAVTNSEGAFSQLRHNIRRNQTMNEVEVDASHFSLEDAPTIGVGGFGLVRLACKLSSTGADQLNVYAIKSISKKSVLGRSSGPQAVFNELTCLKKLAKANSPFIANICYAFQDNRYLYLCMLYYPGGDLRYNLKLQPGHRFPETICRFYIAQCLLAIDTCHSAYILHRDLKPENLLLDAMGYLKLTDFGVSKHFDSPLMVCKSTSGTHGYMAPEIYAKSHIHGREVDYFAVGVTLHELCLGQRPFEVSALRKLYTLIHRRPPITASPNGSDYDFHDYAADSALSHELAEEETLRNAGLTLDLLHSAPFLSRKCKDFISGLLIFRPEYRLGSKGFATIVSHSWFHGFDWKGLQSQTLSAPVLRDCSRLRYDARDFNANSIREHFNAGTPDAEENSVFEDYHYGTKATSA